MPRDRRDGWRRLVALLLAAMMIAASCGSDDDEAIDTSSSTSATETTQSPAEDSDEAESEGEEESGAEEEDIAEPVAYDEAFVAMFEEAARADGDLRAAAESRCGYRTDLVISRASQLGEQGELLPLTSGEITGGGFGYEGLPPSALGLLTGPLYLYRLPAGLDAYEVSQVVDVRPILLAGFVPHWGYAPGEQATEVAEDAQALADLFSADDSTEVPAVTEPDSVVVGVIDTGLVVPSDGFPWPDERVVTATSLLNPPSTSSDVDREPDGFDATYRGHGTFVASLILQQEPSSRVVVAAVRNSPAELFVNYLPDQTQTHPDDETKPPTPDEVQMLGAVGRLVEANVDGTPVEYDALNVSMGAYDCVGLTDQGLAIEAAVEFWNSEVRSAPIVAAAGNSRQADLGVQFLPASLEAVESVVALDASGADLAAYSARQVNDDVQAIGSGLIGFRGDGKLWSWSGTSFATAIVSASVAASPQGAIPDTVDLSTTRVIAQN